MEECRAVPTDGAEAARAAKGKLRAAFGCFTTGVVVVTAAAEGTVHGMTANSFTSVSLEPPLVLVCVHNDARMCQLLERGMPIGLSILAASQRDISGHFASKIAPRVEVAFHWVQGVPLIQGSLANFVGRIHESMVVGDHSVYIIVVEHFDRTPETPPLVFQGGGYRLLVTHTESATPT